MIDADNYYNQYESFGNSHHKHMQTSEKNSTKLL